MMDEAQRRQLVRGCLRLTRETAWAADGYEVRLLVQFIQGELTINQVCGLVSKRITPLPANSRPIALHKSGYPRLPGFPPKSGRGAAAPTAG